MSKLVAIYKQPENIEAFDQAYFQTHLPLIAKVPGLQKTVITRFSRTLMGEPIYMMAEMHFADTAAMKNGLRSPEMVAAGENLSSFAQEYTILAMGEEEKAATNPPQGATISAAE